MAGACAPCSSTAESTDLRSTASVAGMTAVTVSEVGRSGACLFWLCWLSAAGVARPALGQSLAVSIEVDPCVPVDNQKLLRLLAIELGGAEIRAGEAPTSVIVDCVPQGIELRLQDAVTHKSMRRVLPASSFRDASTSPRLLALVVAEFVVASWIELSVRAPNAPLPGPPVQPELTRAAQRIVAEHTAKPAPSLDETSLSAALSTQFWAASDALFLGVLVRWMHAAGSHVVLTSAVELATASTDVAAGSVDAVTASLTFALALHAQIGAFEVYSGPGGRGGMASLQGSSEDPTMLSGYRFAALYGGLVWWNRLEYRGFPRLRLALEVEAGLTTLPVHATAPPDNDSVFALSGLSIGAALSIGWRL
jgi:hypothetical protein